MDARTSQGRAPSTVGAVGGALLVVGSLLTWASFVVDGDALAGLLGVNASLVEGLVPGGSDRTLSGLTAPADGAWTLGAGVIVVAAALLVMVRPHLSVVAGPAMIVAGAVAIGWTVYDVAQIRDLRGDAAGIFASSLQGAGVDVGSGDGLVEVSVGIGLWLALAGGVVAVMAGALVLGRLGRGTEAAGSSTSAASAFVGEDDPDPASASRALPPDALPAPVGLVPEAPPPPPAGGGDAGSA
jgi:hypothetical protein